MLLTPLLPLFTALTMHGQDILRIFATGNMVSPPLMTTKGHVFPPLRPIRSERIVGERDIL